LQIDIGRQRAEARSSTHIERGFARTLVIMVGASH